MTGPAPVSPSDRRRGAYGPCRYCGLPQSDHEPADDGQSYGYVGGYAHAFTPENNPGPPENEPLRAPSARGPEPGDGFGWQPCPDHRPRRCKRCGGARLVWVDEPCPGGCGLVAGHRSRRAECPAWTEVDGVAVPVREGVQVVSQDPRLTTTRGLVDYALTLRMYGERAPGGDETWAAWDRAADAFMRAALSGATVGAGGHPDADLLEAVAEALASHGAPSRQRPNDLAFKAGAAALAAAGRVLAERLWAKANETQRAVDNAVLIDTADRRRWINMESTYRLAANLALTACGVPEGGDGGAG